MLQQQPQIMFAEIYEWPNTNSGRDLLHTLCYIYFTGAL